MEIVHSIRVVLFTDVKMEPPTHRTVSKVYHYQVVDRSVDMFMDSKGILESWNIQGTQDILDS